MKNVFSLVVNGLLFICLHEIAVQAAVPPNVVIVLADDLGWADRGCYGNTFNEMQNIDRLAREGMRFTQFYAGQTFCFAVDQRPDICRATGWVRYHQHLATIVHHGIEQHGDAIWSFCVPSVANFYPRAWAPKQPGEYSWPEPEDYLGEYRDGFKHPVTVYAATNPGRPMGHEPALLHDGMPGYGIVRMNKPQRTLTMECWPRFSDPSQPGAKQYLGWPKTISQFDNYARQPIGYLADLQIRGATEPVVTVTNERTGELVLAVRIQGQRYRVPAFDDANHTVTVRHGDQQRMFEKRAPRAEPETIVVEF
jgi:hypothetical protein